LRCFWGWHPGHNEARKRCGGRPSVRAPPHFSPCRDDRVAKVVSSPRSSSSSRPRRQGHPREVVLVAKVILVAVILVARSPRRPIERILGVSLSALIASSVQSRDSYFQFLSVSRFRTQINSCLICQATFLHLPSVMVPLALSWHSGWIPVIHVLLI